MAKTKLDKSDIKNIIDYYKTGKFSMKTLGSMYHTSHHRIRNILIKFYYDDKYNKIYHAYIESGFDDYLRPSLDHIVPKSAKGTNDINNLRFVTWFENRAKNNMSLERWEYIKANIHRYLI